MRRPLPLIQILVLALVLFPSYNPSRATTAVPISTCASFSITDELVDGNYAIVEITTSSELNYFITKPSYDQGNSYGTVNIETNENDGEINRWLVFSNLHESIDHLVFSYFGDHQFTKIPLVSNTPGDYAEWKYRIHPDYAANSTTRVDLLTTARGESLIRFKTTQPFSNVPEYIQFRLKKL